MRANMGVWVSGEQIGGVVTRANTGGGGVKFFQDYPPPLRKKCWMKPCPKGDPGGSFLRDKRGPFSRGKGDP